nr:DUF4157 domain-containing protein [Corallococcus exiguus]
MDAGGVHLRRSPLGAPGRPEDEALTSGGQPLPGPLRHFYEKRTGHDLGAVRVHSGSEAARRAEGLDAEAFAYSHHIWLGAGQPVAPSRTFAHEVAHVIQQSAAPGSTPRVLRKPKTVIAPTDEWPRYRFFIRIPGKVSDQEFLLLMLMQVFGIDRALAERVRDGYELEWSSRHDLTPEELKAGRVEATLPVHFYDALMGGYDASDTAAAKKAKQGATALARDFKTLPSPEQQKLNEATDELFWERSEYKRDEKLAPATNPRDREQARLWLQLREQLLRARLEIQQSGDLLSLKPEDLQPSDYPQVLRLIDKLKGLNDVDLALYRQLARVLTKDLNRFEQSLDAFIEYRARFEKDIQDALTKQGPAAKKGEPTLEEQLAGTWKGVDEASFSKLTEVQRQDLARRIAGEQRNLQLKHMATHPLRTAGGMVEGVFRPDKVGSDVIKDLTEAANGDKSAWARFAGGFGALGKSSGWLAGAAAVLWVALLFVPGANIAQLAATMGAVALYAGTTSVVASAVESELRIQAAGEATSLDEFKHQTEASAAAQTQFYSGLALMVAGLTIKLVARVKLPGRQQTVGDAFKVARDGLLKETLPGAYRSIRDALVARLKGQKAGVLDELQVAKAELAKQRALIEGMTGDELVGKLAGGDPAFYELIGITPEQAARIQKLINTPAGRNAPSQLKKALLEAMDDAPGQAQGEVTRFLDEVDRAVSELEKASTDAEFQTALDSAEKLVDPNAAVKHAEQAQADYLKKKLEAAARQPPSDVPPADASPSTAPKVPDAPAKAGEPRTEPAKAGETKAADTATVVDAFEALAKKHGFSADLLARLRAAGVDPVLLDDLIAKTRGGKGSAAVTPEAVAEMAARFGPKGMRIAEALVTRKLNPSQAVDTARAAGELGVLDEVRALVDSPRFSNPTGLRKFLRDVQKSGHLGDLRSLRDVVRRIDEADAKGVEGEIKLDTGGGDVVDAAARDAVQHKEVSGNEAAIRANMDKASKQLRGETGEVPPAGFRRVAHLHLTETNPLFRANRATLSEWLRATLRDFGASMNFKGTDQFKFTNANGTFTFDAPDFL